MSLSGPPCRYAIDRPSGLHAGRLSVSGSLSGPSNIVSWRGAALPPGAASITYRSQLLSRSASGRRLLTKTSDLPSGDQAGQSWVCSSSRLERNASHRPSGLQRGVFSPAFEVVRRTLRVPSQLAIQTALLFRSSAVSGVETVYATQAPSGEISGSRTSRRCSTSSSENGRGGAERETAVGACAPSAGTSASPARVGMSFAIMREANPGLALRARG